MLVLPSRLIERPGFESLAVAPASVAAKPDAWGRSHYNSCLISRFSAFQMKIIAIASLLACLSPGAWADDLATPSPTPIYPYHLARPGSLRRVEQLDHQRALQTEADTRAQARQQAKANRAASATAEAQARLAVRTKEKAQQHVDAEARRESAKATPKSTSELMKEMGFSDEEVAAQKAREDSAKPGAKQTINLTPEKPSSASPAPQSK
jgi:hypothetical protein